MRYNRKKHFLLIQLQKKEQANRGKGKANLSGLTFEKMKELLNVNRNELEIIISGLLNNKEVDLFDINGEQGALIDDELGFLAISSKKYLKRNEDIIIKWFKNFTQIIIPIASLIIAYLALTIKLNAFKADIEQELKNESEKEIQLIKEKLGSLTVIVENKKKKQ